MKKIFSSTLVLFSVLTLAACTPSTTSAPSTSASASSSEMDDATATATLIVKLPDKTLEKQVTFEVGDSVMDVLDDTVEVEEDNGLVTSIEGVSQDEATSTYWMYKVNDEMAEVGAEQFEVKADDKIEFYLEKF